MLLLPCGILDLHKIIVACVPSVKNYRNTRHGPFFPPWNRYIRVLITEPSPHFSIFFSFHPPFSPSLSLSSFQRGNLSPLITRSRKFVHISVSHPPPTPCQPPFPSLPYPHPFLSSPCVPYKGDVEQWEKDREIRGIWAEGCGGWPSKDVVIYIRRIIRIYIYIYQAKSRWNIVQVAVLSRAYITSGRRRREGRKGEAALGAFITATTYLLT